MSRITAVETSQAQGKVAELLTGVKKMLGG